MCPFFRDAVARVGAKNVDGLDRDEEHNDAQSGALTHFGCVNAHVCVNADALR